MFKLSPSDFAYLYEECKLCYYLKVKHSIYQPSMPMPGVFSAINSRIQGTLIGKNLRDLSKDLPEGNVESQEGWVNSKIIPNTNSYIKGKYDLLVKRKDNSYLLVDLKISQPGNNKIDKYETQLNSYKYALENPKHGKAVKISKMGLLIFYPDQVTFKEDSAVFTFPPTWLEVPINEKGFLKFAKNINDLLSGEPPEESPSCKWCQYRHTGEKISHIKKSPVEEELPF